MQGRRSRGGLADSDSQEATHKKRLFMPTMSLRTWPPQSRGPWAMETASTSFGEWKTSRGVKASNRGFIEPRIGYTLIIHLLYNNFDCFFFESRLLCRYAVLALSASCVGNYPLFHLSVAKVNVYLFGLHGADWIFGLDALGTRIEASSRAAAPHRRCVRQ